MIFQYPNFFRTTSDESPLIIMKKPSVGKGSDMMQLMEIRHIIEKSSLERKSEDIENVTKIYSEIKDLGDKFEDLKEFVVGIKKNTSWILGRNFDFEAGRIFDEQKVLKWEIKLGFFTVRRRIKNRVCLLFYIYLIKFFCRIRKEAKKVSTLL